MRPSGREGRLITRGTFEAPVPGAHFAQRSFVRTGHPAYCAFLTTITDSDSDLGLDFEKQAGLVTSHPQWKLGGMVALSSYLVLGRATAQFVRTSERVRRLGAHVTPSRLPSLFGIR